MGVDIYLKMNNKILFIVVCEYGFVDVVKNIIKGRGGLIVSEFN